MDKQLLRKLSSIMKEQLPTGEPPVHAIMDILSLGKEAAYRRLRGVVPFTFEDMIKISQRFGISMDEIASQSKIIAKSRWATFDVDLFFSTSNYFAQYSKNMNLLISILSDTQQSKKSLIRCAVNILPDTLLLPFKMLSLFNHFKWNSLMNGVNPDFHFSKMVLPPNVAEQEKLYLKNANLAPRVIIIMDRGVFTYMINDINYFLERDLISKKDVQQLKQELLDLVSYIENLSATGHHENGGEITFYLSDIKIDSYYVHLETDQKEVCITSIYFVDNMLFYNAKICQRHKNWIEQLKRYSVLITQSGEKERFSFFNKQRKMIEDLL